MKILALLAATAAILAMPLSVQAGPAPSVAVSLSCARGVGASEVHVQFWRSLFDQTVVGEATLSCGPDSISGLKADRQKVALPEEPGWVNITMFTIATAAGNGGCVGGGAIPSKTDCQILGTGPAATLTVR